MSVELINVYMWLCIFRTGFSFLGGTIYVCKNDILLWPICSSWNDQTYSWWQRALIWQILSVAVMNYLTILKCMQYSSCNWRINCNSVLLSQGNLTGNDSLNSLFEPLLVVGLSVFTIKSLTLWKTRNVT